MLIYRIVNPIVALLLRSPFHGLLSKNTLLISFTGRTSGKRYSTPLSYIRDDNTITLMTTGNWWKNLRGGAPVTVWVAGRKRDGVATPRTDPAEVADAMQIFFPRVRRDARMYGVRLGADGQPSKEDCARAAQTTVMVKVEIH
jgi:F420H(2)-dependent quinone reductase